MVVTALPQQLPELLLHAVAVAVVTTAAVEVLELVVLVAVEQVVSLLVELLEQ
jgi:hypothetical protein